MSWGSSPFGSNPWGAPGGSGGTSEVGVISAGLSVLVAHAIGSVAAALTVAVAERGTIAAGITVQVVANTGTVSAVLALVVGERGTVGAGIAVAVLPLSAFVPGGQWRPVVTLGGADISARLTGTVSVEIEEGASRLADFSFVPAPGAVNLPAYSGKAVTIDFARMDNTGAALYAVRLFSGVSDLPALDAVAKTISLRCTDELPHKVSRLTRAQVDALIGGYWSAAVFGDPDDVWDYASLRLETCRGALDTDADGGLRFTPWQAKAVADLEYAAGDVLDATPRLAFAARDQIRNTHVARFEYRIPRCRVRRIGAGYRYPFGLDSIMIDGLGLPTRAMVEQALAATGWELAGDINWTPVPTGPVTVNLGGTTQGVWDIDPAVAEQLCMGFVARLQRRWVQWVSETYTLSVTAAESVAALGELRGDSSAALAVAFDSGAWEGNAEALPVVTPPVLGDAHADASVAGESDRAAADAAIATLVARAQAGIIGSHRHTHVGFAVPLDVRADVTRTARIVAGGITAKGKLVRVRHSMDLAGGGAITEMEIAVLLATAVGVATPSLAAAPPPPADVVSQAQQGQDAGTYVGSTVASAPWNPDTMVGYATNVSLLSPDYWSTAPVYPVQFSYEAPGIEAGARDNIEIPIAAAYSAAITPDEFAVTI